MNKITRQKKNNTFIRRNTSSKFDCSLKNKDKNKTWNITMIDNSEAANLLSSGNRLDIEMW